MRIGHRKLLGLYITCSLLLAVVVIVLSILPTPTAPATAWHTSAASGPLKDTPVRNFGVVEQGILYRSAQPHPLALPWLRRYGIASIVNLREEQYENDARLLAGLGYTSYLHLPIDDHAPPTDAQATEFLAFVQDQRHWPVLVHCAEGKGRTGVLVALARYAIDGWTIEQALAEANNYTSKLALSDTQRTWLAQWSRRHAPGDQRATLQPATEQES
jgi:protein-tyrosine phosphatase